jgi:L-threonylcarbamoyladenylate synthase
MEIIKFNLGGHWEDFDQEIIDQAIETIRKGGSIIYPTDTVYGLGVDALNTASVSRLFKIKKRATTKPVPVMVRDVDMAEELAFIDYKRRKALEEIWPGPVTAILEKKNIVPDILTAGKKTIGLRMPDHIFTENLMEKLNRPITVTSANISGDSPMTSASEVIKIFSKSYPHPDLILDAGDLPESQASTVLDLTGSYPKIIRIGPVNKNQLMKMLK